jgi:trehalose 6-phosphate phosphatase
MTDAQPPLPIPTLEWALFLDIDGTLIDIAATPDAVVVRPELPDILRRLADLLNGAVALVSGRSLADVDRLFTVPGLSAAGQHGAEIRAAEGGIEIFDAAAQQLAALAPAIADFAAARPGILIESKGMATAIHCRQVPHYQSELGAFLDDLVAGSGGQLETIRGHRVFEIKPRNLSKRTAVEHFMRSPPFAGRLPVFIGDDRTDEDGFAAVQAMGGHAIHVGLTGASLATWRIAGPAEVRTFLSSTAEILAVEVSSANAR